MSHISGFCLAGNRYVVPGRKAAYHTPLYRQVLADLAYLQTACSIATQEAERLNTELQAYTNQQGAIQKQLQI